MNAIAPQSQLTAWLARFTNALENEDIAALSALFCEDCYWRDLVAFTWNIKTMEGREAIADMAATTLPHTRPTNWQLDGPVTHAQGITEGWLTYETANALGKAHVRLKGQACYTLLTTAEALKGFEERRGPTREIGVVHGAFKDRETDGERRARERAALGHSEQPYVVIIGGGQGGIALGARLKQLGVSTIIVERNERAGDSWRKRYKSLCLHDPVWYDHLPYLPFPDHWPVFSPKDRMGDWLESYTRIMDLNYWTRTTAQSARYDEAAGEWVVAVDKAGDAITLRPKHLVLATGMSGIPYMPELPGADRFAGEIQHSSQHPGPDAYRGKRVVVVGSNNSAHDICAALWEVGADATMVQRSATTVVRSETLMEMALGPLYSEQALARGITTEMADLIDASSPYAIRVERDRALYRRIKARDADFYARLEQAGFRFDFGPDETGLGMKYFRRGSGYYIDVGASELIADGSIKLAHGQVDHFSRDGIVLADGAELPADLVVFATGYGSMNGWAAQLISQEVADTVGICWGLGSNTPKDPGPWEGEFRNMWKPTRQQALWFHGGNLHQSRHYSQYLALQLKARAEGLATPVYGLAVTHHPS